MSFSLLANICAIFPLDLELFFNVLRVSALFGCCHGRQPSRPVAPSYLCPYWDISFPMPCRRHVCVTSHHCHLPNPVLVPIIPPFDDEQAVSTATGPFPLKFFANYIVSWCIMQDMRSIQWFLAREHGSVLCT